jgi:3'(2'), 5'-bisphosphate nucleotidase
MLTDTAQLNLVPALIQTAARAGAAIMEVYESDDQQVEHKADASPLTLADRRAHDIIDAALRELTPDIPILSEEGAHLPYAEREAWTELWLVDPLDGTKEFLKHNGEFTVNIALVQSGEPVLGVIFAPARRDLWAGVSGQGAWKIPAEDFPEETDAIPRSWRDSALPIAVREHNPARIDIIASRTHYDDRTAALIDRISADFAEVGIVNVGSSLKLCTIAEGAADLYPRYAPTSEWDTAAGHAIVRAAGGEIYQAGEDLELPLEPSSGPGIPAHKDYERFGHSPRPLEYNKEEILNPWFVVRSW